MVNTSPISVSQRQAQAERCHRCGGLMVSEPVHELASFDWHCVSCGERIDPVILAHRGQNAADSSRAHIGTRQRPFSLS